MFSSSRRLAVSDPERLLAYVHSFIKIYIYCTHRVYHHFLANMIFASLTGPSLARARICFIVAPAFLLYGYNQSNIGGVLDYPSFIKHFPPIDTSNTTGSIKNHNATIQGMFTHPYSQQCS